jgi:prolyl oligopeptidase
VAPIRDVTQVLHGVTVHDPYRYIEDVKSTEVHTWLRSQGDATREVLDGIDMRVNILQRIEKLSTATGDSINSIVRMPGERTYYLGSSSISL